MNIMIVDDEQLIRRHLAELKEWEQIGCSIVGEAANGEEALQLAHQCKPDLVISDIRMPIMDGIQFAGAMRSLYPNTPIIFISAYHDFVYAKQALKLGAADFITKPIDLNELIDAVELIMQGASRANTDDRMLQEKMVRMLLSDKPDLAELEKQASWSEVAGKQTMMLSIEVDNIELAESASEPPSLFMLREKVCHMMNGYPYPYWTCMNRRGVYLIVFQPDQPLGDMKSDSMKISRDIVSRTKSSFDHSISIGISRLLPSVEHLRSGLEDIQECLDYRMLLGKGSIISGETLSSIRDETGKKDEVNVAKLLDILPGGDREKIMSFLRSVYREMLAKGLGKTQVQHYAIEIMERAERLLDGYEQPNGKEERIETHKIILSYDILSDLMKFLEHKLIEIAEKVANNNKQSVHVVIRNVMQYLEAHYREEITLVSLSKALCINHSYLSRFIKKETGINFRDLLWRTRIGKAQKQLEETETKSFQIAYDVGFKDASHFSQLFKQTVGVSPTEYRERHLQKARKTKVNSGTVK
ncbi:response regulator [Paenibacillus sp. MBLB4367]|uniref:response regulator n=1 Tax=Paenibacillus sp. MBLB4367 TaxID=3384767 RepID=UPI003908053E